MAHPQQLDKLRRVTDLFVEGEAVDLGDDAEGNPVVIWVNKLNSFQSEEARRDGSAARQDRILELVDDKSSETQRMRAELVGKVDEHLFELVLQHESSLLVGEALQIAQGDEGVREKQEYLERQAELLDEAEVPPADPRRGRLSDEQKQYMATFNKALDRVRHERVRELRDLARTDLENQVMQSWRDAVSMQEFMGERRVTQLYFALRDCNARRDAGRFDHTKCNHSHLLLETRKQVRELPDSLLVKVSEAFDRLEMGPAESGNSDVPASSSASSEQPNEPEASTPSTQGVTPNVAATT